MKILVVSRHFAFRGPLAAAFLKSFSSKLQVWGYAWDGAETWQEITKKMLWESFLEDTEVPLADRAEVENQRWDAVIMLVDESSIAKKLNPGGKAFSLPLAPLSDPFDPGARALRDAIKNDTFVLLRDVLIIKPGS
ncbi:MAG: hypothetical protein LWX09_07320 [Bacteroidia bacterium]|nr:hypothetical protein [Bacteroidia bacterium]